MFSEDNKPDLKSNLAYSIEHHYHQKRILAFLQDNLSRVTRRFTGTTFNLAASKEDDMTREIVNLLNDRRRMTGGYLFGFEAKIGPDILIYALPYELFAPALFVIEAKRLPPTRSRDYVHSGIGRFIKKRSTVSGTRLPPCWLMSKTRISLTGIRQ